MKTSRIMKVDFPRFATAEVQIAYLSALQTEIIEMCVAPGLLLDFLKDLWALSEPIAFIDLPWTAKADVLPLRHFDEIAVSARFPKSYTIVPLMSGGGSELVLEGRTYSSRRSH